jgi:4-amino-4-deoxy-L-arabinose transferase-like glycosyltransferase
MKRPTRLLLVAAALAAYAIYATGLSWSPVYLAHDEVMYALNAQSIATTGRDLNGRLLPVFFYVVGNFWATPINIYLTALCLKVLPLSESAIRLPSTIIGIVDVVLIYFIAKRMFTSEWLPAVAAGLLALTPAHFIHSRLAVDHLYPVPFMLAWLLCLLVYEAKGRLGVLFAGTCLLGIGVYSYLAAMVMMPVYFVVTCVVLLHMGQRAPKPYVVALAGFVLPLLPLVPWYATHPQQWSQQIRMYHIYDASRFNPLQGLRELASYVSLTERTSVYWDYFNPSFLLFSGDASLIDATRAAGVFLVPVGVLIAIGMYRAAVVQPTRHNLLLVAGVLTAPLAATLVAERYKINRALVLLPFAVLIATRGFEQLIFARRAIWRIVGIALIALAPVQFYYFYADYFTDYRVRSSPWFEGNLRGALERIIERDGQHPLAAIYFDADIQWVNENWRLYLIKHGRLDLAARTKTVDPKTLDLEAVPPSSVILVRSNLEAEAVLAATGSLRKADTINELDHSASFSIFQK